MTKTDSDIERDVNEKLQWSPDLDSADIAVSVKQGVVTLNGFIDIYLDKYEAKAAAKRVAGVIAAANDIEVRLPSVDQRHDPEIARDDTASIKTHLPVSQKGKVEWRYQKTMVEQAVRGVKEIKHEIEEAFRRNAKVDANRIIVEANGGEVILKATVWSGAERQETERIAWSARSADPRSAAKPKWHREPSFEPSHVSLNRPPPGCKRHCTKDQD